MNTEQLSFGQRIDPENGLVECWFTHGALDWIKEQDWSNKVVLMYGAGSGDAWLAKRCKLLYVVERNEEWLFKARNNCEVNNVHNHIYCYRPCNDCSGEDEMYCAIPDGYSPDIVIVDDAYRYECIVKALTLPRPLTLIVDNWNQDYVFICPAAVELLKDFKQDIFPCTTHTHHEGNCWKTAIFYIQ
jgi:hypothetical protein